MPIRVHSWFQPDLFPIFLCISVPLWPTFIRVHQSFQYKGFPMHSMRKSAVFGGYGPYPGMLLFVVGTKSNQKTHRSNGAEPWFTALVQSVHAACGWASCPSSAASIALGLVPRSVCRCFFIPFSFVFIRGFKPGVFVCTPCGNPLWIDDTDRIRGCYFL